MSHGVTWIGDQRLPLCVRFNSFVTTTMRFRCGMTGGIPKTTQGRSPPPPNQIVARKFQRTPGPSQHSTARLLRAIQRKRATAAQRNSRQWHMEPHVTVSTWLTGRLSPSLSSLLHFRRSSRRLRDTIWGRPRDARGQTKHAAWHSGSSGAKNNATSAPS